MRTLIDLFIANHSFPTESDLRRARTLVGIILALFIGLVGYSVFIYFTVYWVRAEVAIDSWLFVLPLTAIMGLSLAYMRFFGHFFMVANVLVGVLSAVLLITVSLTGGPSQTPALPLLVVPVMIAFCVAGRGAGLFWGSLVMLCTFFLAFMAFAGYEFITIADQTFLDRVVLMNWAVAFIATVLIALVYESMNVDVHRAQLERSQRYHHLASHDPLTGLSNRRSFEERLVRACEEYNSAEGFLAVMFVDLDDFKPINDRYGHAAGDRVLADIADRLRSALRVTDSVARIGGDEFAVLAVHIRNEEVLKGIIEKLISVISQPLDEFNQEVRVTASIGVAYYPQHTREPKHLMELADKAMYRAKTEKHPYSIHSAT